MISILLALALARCDNFQLRKGDFDSVAVGRSEYFARDMRDGARLKISFPGHLFYELVRDGRSLSLRDASVYTKARPRAELRVFVEEVAVADREIAKLALVLANVALFSAILFRFVFPVCFEQQAKQKLC